MHLSYSDSNMSEELTRVGTVSYVMNIFCYRFTPDYRKLMLTVPYPGIFLPCVLGTCNLYLNMSEVDKCVTMEICKKDFMHTSDF